MYPDLHGHIAFITGGARGQGRSHAVALARAGADVGIIDICSDLESPPYHLSTTADLEQTRRLVEAEGRRCVAVQGDVRDRAALGSALETVSERIGMVDICVANAGIVSFGAFADLDGTAWDEMLGVNLTGVFNTFQAVLRQLDDDAPARLIAISSAEGRSANPNLAHYVATKWAVIGLVKSLALEVAHLGTTVNAICPSTVDTPMVHNESMYRLFCPDFDDVSRSAVEPRYAAMNPMGVPWLDPNEISDAVLYLASDAARHITGTTLEVAAGSTTRMP